MNNSPSLREDNERKYLRSLQHGDAQRDREQYANKGRDTLLDKYSEDEFEQLLSKLEAHSTAANSSSAAECHFTTLADILLRHYVHLRGGDYLSIEILDLFMFKFKREAPIRSILIFTTRSSKYN
ncbi:hypothetical protein CC78DRAFT_360949 [Lojkania enalia]|uniref:Uncharacterized protein n=1 Tax=Lojkania enalia TaxID=147567 RepID=A0A9P4K1I8_9PLEO|nr:hypothetical protein CC78DRAFT_360949 [Didymosphaeria enalia]